jgi:pyruvate/2-oxoglutarate dehydrogenase complex dihydrolipoamide acyltransferase (E2) component
VAKVTMPQLGESVAEGTIGKWLKQPGDHVAKYEPLLEVITDKVNAEVPSPFEGTLTEILVEEGATVPNNAEIAIIETADAADASDGAGATSPVVTSTPDTAPAAAATTAVSPGPSDGAGTAHGPAGSDERPTGPAPTAVPMAASAAPIVGDPDARMTPAVRRLLREHGLTAGQIVGTGGGGRITREDVIDHVEAVRTGRPVGAQSASGEAPGASPAAPAGDIAPLASASAPASVRKPALPPTSAVVFAEGADEVLVPMTQMRKGIAAQMTRALSVPHAWVSMEVDASSLVRLRESAKHDFQAREGLSLSYVPFVVKASAEALRRHPEFNAHWTDAGLLAKRRINVGVAVAVDDGLIVPVIRDVDGLSIAGLNRAIADVAARARANRLKLDDFGGGTFTIDNTGWLGSNMTMPIINVPEVGILTMEAITKRAVVVESPTGDSIAIRPVMNMVLGLDHRANDGAGGAAFLRTIKTWLEAVGPDTALF